MSIFKIAFTAVSVLFSILTFQAQAQQSPSTPPETAQLQAQPRAPWSRSGRGELFGQVQFLGKDTTTGLNGAIETTIDDMVTFGGGAGYNINDYLNINGTLYYGNPDLTAKAGRTSLTSSADWLGGDINLDVNILKGQLTPMVSGGIGFVNLSGDIRGIEYDETDFSYNFGGGVRWNPGGSLSFKALYRATWVDLEDSDDPSLLDGFTIIAGYMF